MQHAPEVGKTLADHLCVWLGFGVKNDTLAGAEKPLELVNYLVRRRGMLTSNAAEDGFIRSRPSSRCPISS